MSRNERMWGIEDGPSSGSVELDVGTDDAGSEVEVEAAPSLPPADAVLPLLAMSDLFEAVFWLIETGRRWNIVSKDKLFQLFETHQVPQTRNYHAHNQKRPDGRHVVDDYKEDIFEGGEMAREVYGNNCQTFKHKCIGIEIHTIS